MRGVCAGSHFSERMLTLSSSACSRALMIASCILDFTIPDLTRPKPKRFKKQLCALLNFLHFSQHQIHHFDELKEEKDKIFNEKETLNTKVVKIRGEVEAEEELRRSQEEEALQLREENVKLAEKWRSLMEKEKVLERLERENQKVHDEAKGEYYNLRRECEGLAREIEKLQMRIDDDPTQLREMLEKRRWRIKEKEQACHDEEMKTQSMAQKKRVLESLEADITNCVRLVKSCLEEQLRLTREQQELDKIRKEKTAEAGKRDDLTLQMDQARQRLKYAEERLDKMRRTLESKRDENKRKVDVSNERWQEAQREKRRRSEKAEAIHRQVATIEAEYEQITRNFDAFYTDLSQQKEKLDKNTRRYMQEVAQRMDLQVDFL